MIYIDIYDDLISFSVDYFFDSMTKFNKSFLKSNIHGMNGEICQTYPYRTFYALDMTVTVVYA